MPGCGKEPNLITLRSVWIEDRTGKFPNTKQVHQLLDRPVQPYWNMKATGSEHKCTDMLKNYITQSEGGKHTHTHTHKQVSLPREHSDTSSASFLAESQGASVFFGRESFSSYEYIVAYSRRRNIEFGVG